MSTFTSDTPTHNLNDMNTSSLNYTSVIKNEPLSEIDMSVIKNEPTSSLERNGYENENCKDANQNTSKHNDSPKIRLTPTAKLMATPNPIDPKRKFVCSYENCTKSYGKSSHLRSHLTWHTGVKPFVCREITCQKGFTRSDELNRHIRTHTGEKPFECSKCLKKFSRSDHLTKHLATHAKQMQGIIKTTKTKKAQNTETKTKSRNATTFEDGMHFLAPLGETTEFQHQNQNQQEQQQQQHQQLNVDDRANQTQIESNVPAIVQIKTEQTDEWNAQMQWQNFDTKTEVPETKANAIIMPEVNVSEYCKNNFINYNNQEAGWNQNSMNAVNDDHGSHDPQRPHRCSYCMKSFRRQDDLNRHMRIHTGEKPYACTECEKRFIRLDHLKKHLKTHKKVNVGGGSGGVGESSSAVKRVKISA